jgi:hypothetical protein
MIKSKYLNKQFDNGWVCTHVGTAAKSRVFKRGTKVRNEYPNHQTYYYIFERITSDGKAEKLVRLNCNEAAAVYRGDITVEEIAETRQEDKEKKFTKKVSYHFIGK